MAIETIPVNPLIFFGLIIGSFFLLLFFTIISFLYRMHYKELKAYHEKEFEDLSANKSAPIKKIRKEEEVAFSIDESKDIQQNNGLSYREYLTAALEATGTYYKNQFNAEKITINPAAKLQQQVVAIRYAFLSAEKKAESLNDNPGKFWKQIEINIKNIIAAYQKYFTHVGEAKSQAFYEPKLNKTTEEISQLYLDNNRYKEQMNEMDNIIAGLEKDIEESRKSPPPTVTITDEAEIDQLKQQLTEQKNMTESLETFKKLYLAMQEQCDQIHKDGSDLFKELNNAATSFDQNAPFNDLLKKYNNKFNSFHKTIMTQPDMLDQMRTKLKEKRESKLSEPEIKEMKLQFDRLKTIAVNQNNVIKNLKQQLKEFKDNGADPAIIQELEVKITQVEKALRETEMCIQILEQNNEMACQEIEQLTKDFNDAKDEQVIYKNQMEQVKNNNQQLAETIETFQNDNMKLKQAKLEHEQRLDQIEKEKASEIKDLQIKIAEVEKSNTELSESQQQLQTEIDATKSLDLDTWESSSLETQLEEKESALKALQEKLAILESQIEAQGLQPIAQAEPENNTLNNQLKQQQNDELAEHQTDQSSAKIAPDDSVTESIDTQPTISEVTPDSINDGVDPVISDDKNEVQINESPADHVVDDIETDDELKPQLVNDIIPAADPDNPIIDDDFSAENEPVSDINPTVATSNVVDFVSEKDSPENDIADQLFENNNLDNNEIISEADLDEDIPQSAIDDALEDFMDLDDFEGNVMANNDEDQEDEQSLFDELMNDVDNKEKNVS